MTKPPGMLQNLKNLDTLTFKLSKIFENVDIPVGLVTFFTLCSLILKFFQKYQLLQIKQKRVFGSFIQIKT